ncbi:MAG: TonB-dependent receptor [Steroidobacteraceae bacterium]
MRNAVTGFTSIVVSSLLMQTAVAQAPPADANETAELIELVVTGTRVADRSALDTAVPVDVINSEALTNLGVSEIAQALSIALPSLNFPRPGLSDGTDTVRPATLRGLAPDQTLVLLNGKRRHSSALVNLNQTVGRGSSAVDLNTIPSAMVRSIEVLRDGASAQYGSDAIAGVINLRLRENSSGGDLTGSYGYRETSYDFLVGARPAGANYPAPANTSRRRNDGEVVTASLWKGLTLGQAGFLTVAAEYKDGNHTERGGYDVRRQYPLVNGGFDAREITFNRFNSWYGEPDLTQATLFANAGYQLNDSAKLYGWASYQNRKVKSAGFYRIADDARNVIQIYPDGFLPIIAPDVGDYAAGGGVTWKLGDWDMDTSLVFGKNIMSYTIENTLNRSIGPSSKTEFNAGGIGYNQIVLNLSAVRPVEMSMFFSPLNIAVGVEARREGFTITEGEPDSYRNGGVLLPSGLPAASGSQVFAGFRPTDSTNEHRNAVGVYADFEANVTEKFLASAAIRGEHYSDFGSNASGKISARYDFVPAFALRGSAQNGFRAPSLQQQFFRTASTNFVNGIPFDVLTFPVSDPIAAALGAQPLDAEKSINFSLGAVMQFGLLSLTVDAYQINIDDRIVLSENLTSAPVQAYLNGLGFAGAGGGRFFINGVDTETQGVDIVARYPFNLTTAGKLDVTFTANFNQTDVTKVPVIPQLAALSPAPALFSRIQVLSLEDGEPSNKQSLNLSWTLDRIGATLRGTHYGRTLFPGSTVAFDTPDGAHTLIDIEGRFTFNDHFKAAVGAENVLDEYPDPVPLAVNATGTQSFSNYSPFGRSGRFIYGRLTYSF